jgi:hypothetical protein
MYVCLQIDVKQKHTIMLKEDLNNLVTVAVLHSFSEKIISEMHRLSEKDKPEFYTPSQFSKLIGMPYTTVIHYCKNNMLKARQEFKGGSWQIYASEINRLKEEAKTNHLSYR